MNFLLITHGKLAEGLLDSAKMLIGKLNNVDYISFDEEMGIDELELSIRNYVQENKSDEILILQIFLVVHHLMLQL